MIRARVYQFQEYEFEIVIYVSPNHIIQRMSRVGFVALASGRLIK